MIRKSLVVRLQKNPAHTRCIHLQPHDVSSSRLHRLSCTNRKWDIHLQLRWRKRCLVMGKTFRLCDRVLCFWFKQCTVQVLDGMQRKLQKHRNKAVPRPTLFDPALTLASSRPAGSRHATNRHHPQPSQKWKFKPQRRRQTFIALMLPLSAPLQAAPSSSPGFVQPRMRLSTPHAPNSTPFLFEPPTPPVVQTPPPESSRPSSRVTFSGGLHPYKRAAHAAGTQKVGVQRPSTARLPAREFSARRRQAPQRAMQRSSSLRGAE